MSEPQLHDTVYVDGRALRIVAFSEDHGTKLSDGRWVCASKFVPVTRACWRYEPARTECPPGVHSIFDPCPGDCTKPVIEEDELFEELWSMEYRITGDKSAAQTFARDFLNRHAHALAEKIRSHWVPRPPFKGAEFVAGFDEGLDVAAALIDPEVAT
ncbi:hypothetical protein NPS70_16405 [Streptomyces sp. C10-9-1]|uniref:hypothetical protein n=1 Tax=Streptomyces sp. C10-9-1 TaxID=1859285 RepID=UPI0021114B9F|nr:hypothetical protein [Streptomyces sp. C10-9-1]MCQ6554768.1 hypothetical protein [Streptomyces sp. C10-9-1]